MNVRYSKRFLKQLAGLPPEIRVTVERFAFEQLPSAVSLAEIGKIERLRGYSGFYKARFGAFRVGLRFETGVVSLQVVMDRKEIYRFFP